MASLPPNASLMTVFMVRGLKDGRRSGIMRQSMRKSSAKMLRPNRRTCRAPQHAWHPDPASWAPGGSFNCTASRWKIGFPIKGVIWYQGESNTAPAFAPMYSNVFPALISNRGQSGPREIFHSFDSYFELQIEAH